MKLTVLTENTAGAGFLAEHGLSYLIESNGHKLLFDCGHSGCFLKNAAKMGLQLATEIQTVVLSHGHWDHGDGLRYMEGKTLVAHPSIFMKRYRKDDLSYIGLTLQQNELQEKFWLTLSEKPFSITQNICFLGSIPRVKIFESQSTSFVDDKGMPDFVPDDSALAIVENGVLMVVTGCSHAGICNIVEYAKKVTQTEKVGAVIGGFHLKHENAQTRETIEYFKQSNIQHIYPSHCTELPALCAFQKAFGISQLKTGQVLELGAGDGI
jgi:7,8-dihydropterin-6-yl-methyl-4-(beta-D-ribofuranosyl)aminobenzene 5'-phosphate synthase